MIPVNLRSILVLFLALVSFSQCRDENIKPANGDVQFSFDSNERSNSGGRLSAAFEPAMVLLSVQTPTGSAVVTLDELQLYKFQSEGYLSDALQLPEGQYKLTDYVVLNSAREAIAATPKEGSALAAHVTDPLPIQFEVRRGQSIMVKPQVVAFSENIDSDDLGYSVFSFDLVDLPVVTYKKLKEIEWKHYDELSDTYLTTTKYTYTYTGLALTSLDIRLTSYHDREYPLSWTKHFTIDYNSNNQVSKVSTGPWAYEYTYLPNGKISRIVEYDYSYNNTQKLSADHVYDYSIQNKITIRTHLFSSPYNSDPSPQVTIVSMENGNPVMIEEFFENSQYDHKMEYNFDTNRNPFAGMGVLEYFGNGFDFFDGPGDPSPVINFNNVLTSKYTDSGAGESEYELPSTSTYTYDSDGYPLTRTVIRGSSKKIAIFRY